MRRTSPVTALIIVLLAAASVFLFVQNRRNAQSLVALQLTEQATRQHYGQAISEIAAIQDSLNAISISGGIGSMRSAPLSDERRLSPTHGDEVLARVGELRAGIERARDRIQQLEVGLRESGVRVAGLLHMVAQLKDGVAAKEQMVAELSSRVDSLQTHVSGLTAAVEESQTHIAVQDSTLEDRRRELGTVYCIVGTRHDLLKRGAVVARGGLLGLGRTLDPSGKVDEAACTVVDTDAQSVIPIPSPHARVLTPQPPGSYTLEPVNGQLELRILDAREFRKVRHLVIVTA
jgi:hypothetical protein